EQKIITIGPQLEPNFSYANGNIVRDEYRSDKRYGKRTFNEINVYNIYTKSHKTLTKNSRSYSPALSRDGKKIVFVSVDNLGNFNLKEINLEDKITINILPSISG